MKIINIVKIFLLLPTYIFACVCDVSDSCDIQCCCDITCSQNLRSTWMQYGLCSPTYSNGMSIPLCSQYNSIQINDLYSGLRTMYTIIKRLFCLSKINTDLSSYNNQQINRNNIKASSIISNLNSSYSQAVISDPRLTFKNKLQLNNQQILLPTSRSDGRCSEDYVYIGIDRPYIQCRQLIQSDRTTIKYYNNSLSKIKTPTITFYDRSGTILANPTTDKLNKYNLVRYAFIQFQLNDINNTQIDKINLQLTVQNITTTSKTIYQSYQYIWTKSNTPYIRTGNIGYTYGSPLIFANSTHRFSIPLKFPYADFNGHCSNTQLNSYQIKFGIDTVLNCYGIYSGNLNNWLIKVAKIGGAVGSDDFLSINNVSCTNLCVLQFTYSRIGKQQNNMFQITAAKLLLAESKVSGGLSYLYIEFKQVVNKAIINIPPAPSPEINLPDNVLYPFYVY